jgi:hypothetical protein
MTTVDTTPLVEITEKALEVLIRELGLAKTLRFVGQFTAGYGNYTEEREQMFADMTLDDILSEIKRQRKNK